MQRMSSADGVGVIVQNVATLSRQLGWSHWTDLPPKAELERRLHRALIEARERLAVRRLPAPAEKDDPEGDV